MSIENTFFEITLTLTLLLEILNGEQRSAAESVSISLTGSMLVRMTQMDYPRALRVNVRGEIG